MDCGFRIDLHIVRKSNDYSSCFNWAARRHPVNA